MSVYDQQGPLSPTKAGTTRTSSAPRPMNISKAQEHTFRLTQEAATGGGRQPAAVRERIRVYSEALSTVVHVAADDADVTGWEGEIVYRRSDLPLLEGLSRDQMRAVHGVLPRCPVTPLDALLNFPDEDPRPDSRLGFGGWDDPVTEACLKLADVALPKVKGYERAAARRARAEAHELGRRAHAAAGIRLTEMATDSLRVLRDGVFLREPDWEIQIDCPFVTFCDGRFFRRLWLRAKSKAAWVLVIASVARGPECWIKKGYDAEDGFHGPPFPHIEYGGRRVTFRVCGSGRSESFTVPMDAGAVTDALLRILVNRILIYGR